MNVRVDLQETIRDGMEVIFKTPCDASEVTGLNVYYPVDGVLECQTFAFADANTNDLGDLDALFAKDAVVKVILDLDANMAFVQNADTNAYLERRFIELENQIGQGGGGSGGGTPNAVQYVEQVLTDDQQTQARENIGAANKNDLEALASVVEAIQAELSYEEIAITQFSNTASGTHELGKTIGSLTISWELNKAPTSQTLKGESLGVNVRSKTYSSVSTNTTYTLTVKDERGATATKDTSVSFVNGVYYGALDYGTSIDSAVILGLTRKLQSGRSVSFTAGGGKRPTYALPTRYGTPTFKIGGFDYEWEKVKTFDFTNASGYTESYDVWMHSQNVTDSVTVNVT
jgi:hypothetical protein